MKIVLSGGGSGGHITPLLAVAAELKTERPDIQIFYIGQRGDKLAGVVEHNPHVDSSYLVSAGKFRRYHGEGIGQLLDIKTLIKNFRDFFRLLRGLYQSWCILGKVQPDLIFIKGGFVGVPVGLAAAARHIPYVTHDSDALPGLANRIIGRWATAHAVALPKKFYGYPQHKTFEVGVPIAAEYFPVTADQQRIYKRELHLDNYKRILLITGGGLGAQRLNEAVVSITPQLLEHYPDLAVVHLTGLDHESSIRDAYTRALPLAQRRQVIVKGFVTDLYCYSGAADVVVSRAGATNIAEFAIQAKACIVVPNPQLTGGHQLKNAEVLAAHQAVMVVGEVEIQTQGAEVLETAIKQLLNSEADRQGLSKKIAQFAHPGATQQLVQLLLTILEQSRAVEKSV